MITNKIFRKNNTMSVKSGEFVHPPKKKRGRPAKHRAIDPDISGIETANSYDSLTDESIEFHLANEAMKRKAPIRKSTKITKPPPLTVFNFPIKDVKSELVFLGIQGHELKITNYGTKIFTNTNEDFKTIKNHFISKKREFYTHTLNEDRTNKFVIYGLHDMDTIDITNELTLNKIDPCNVKKLQIKKPQREEHTLYLIYFKKSQQTKISDLRKIRSLFHIRIRWDYYRNKQAGPMQCNNCMNYGHGALNCHVKPRCVRCGDGHASKQCPLLQNNLPNEFKIPNEKLKCANCSGNHSAKNMQCPKRKEYVKATQSNRKQKQTNATNHFQTAPQLTNANFPSITQNLSKSWSQSQKYHAASQPNHSSTFINKSSENDLFSTPELMGIIREMLTKLSSCRTKADQFHAIAELACIHIYGK